MTWAFFSDVHGNREALEAVVADFFDQGVTRSLFLGDAVGYGASPNECVEIICDLTEVRLLGNHDEAALKSTPPEDFNSFARAGVLWTRNALTAQSKAALGSFTLDHRGDGLHLVHASPGSPDQWDYILDPLGAEGAFVDFAGPLCLIGHTHQPLVFAKTGSAHCRAFETEELALRPDERYVVNVGSVGQPRDGDPRACYVVFDPEHGQLRYRRVAYDVRAAQEKICQANLPTFLAARLEVGR